MTAGYRNEQVAPSITGPVASGYSEKPDAAPQSGTGCALAGMPRGRGAPLRRELDDLGEPSGFLGYRRVADNVQLRAHPGRSRLLD